MSQILKFSLFFLLSLNVFAAPALDYNLVSGGRDSSFPSWNGLLPGASLISDSYLRVNDNIYQISFKGYGFFNYDKGHTPGIAYQEGNYKYEPRWIFVYESSNTVYTAYCLYYPEGKSLSICKPEYENYKDSKSYGVPIKTTYYASYDVVKKVATCQPGENFNTSTGKCVAPCEAGQKWDQASNSCYADCTDKDKNIFGFKDGKCINCSASKFVSELYDCYCSARGSSDPNKGKFYSDPGWVNPDGKIVPDFYLGACANGDKFVYKDPEKVNPKNPDDPKDPKDPNNKDNNKTDPSNPGGDNPGGGSGGGNTGSETKPNPNHKDNNKTNPGNSDKPKDNNNTVPGGGGKGDNDGINFRSRDFDDGGLEKERNGLYDSIKSHINESISKFDGVRDGIDQFIKNVQGKGFDKIQIEVKKTCPIKKDIPLPNGTSKVVVIDYCKDLSSVSEISYYIFYFFFAVAMFYLIFRILVILI